MSFRASDIIPQEALREVMLLANNLKGDAERRSAEFAGGVTSDRVLSTLALLVSYKEQFDALKDTPGLKEYAQDQVGDSSYDIVAEFIAVIALIQTAGTNIVTTFPKDANGFLLSEKFDSQGKRVWRAFSGAALQTARDDLDAIAASIS